MNNDTLRKAVEYIESRCAPEPNSGCWLWLLSLKVDGYGHATFNSKYIGAHRLAWIAFKGEIPDGLHVLHRCDTRCCVNPEHLFLGTNRDNIDDMLRKGRSRRGERHLDAKLTEEQVRAIRKDPRTHRELSAEYGVGYGVIGQIKRREIWKHVE